MAKLLGAVCGDILGSSFEIKNIKTIPAFEEIIARRCVFTDDTVMTCAVAKGIDSALNILPENWSIGEEAEKIICEEIEKTLVEFGTKYPRAGYGGSFKAWLRNPDRKPYNSWGNGSAMRVSYAGWIGKTFEQAIFLAKCSAVVTHNHPEGVKGAQIVAACIYLLRIGKTKEFVRDFVSKYYDISFTLDEIREGYIFDVSCQGSVPQAIVAFLEGNSFEEVISLAISIGGDSDTIAAISGSIAEVIYPIPDKYLDVVYNALDEYLTQSLAEINI